MKITPEIIQKYGKSPTYANGGKGEYTVDNIGSSFEVYLNYILFVVQSTTKKKFKDLIEENKNEPEKLQRIIDDVQTRIDSFAKKFINVNERKIKYDHFVDAPSQHFGYNDWMPDVIHYVASTMGFRMGNSKAEEYYIMKNRVDGKSAFDLDFEIQPTEPVKEEDVIAQIDQARERAKNPEEVKRWKENLQKIFNEPIHTLASSEQSSAATSQQPQAVQPKQSQVTKSNSTPTSVGVTASRPAIMPGSQQPAQPGQNPKTNSNPQQSATPKPTIAPMRSLNAKNLEDLVDFLGKLKFAPKKKADFQQEIENGNGITKEDCSCVYVLNKAGEKFNVQELTYKNIEKTLFEIVNLPDFEESKRLLLKFDSVLKDMHYSPSFGNMARSLLEIDKIENSALDNVGARCEFIRDTLMGRGNKMSGMSQDVANYLKKGSGVNDRVTRSEQAQVLNKMQENYDKLFFEPELEQPKDFKRLLNVSNIKQQPDIVLTKRSDKEIQDDIVLHSTYGNNSYEPCLYTITNEKGQNVEIWQIPPDQVILRLTKTIANGNPQEIDKMRIICENMQGHFNPSYADVAKLTSVMNDYYQVGGDPNIDKAINALFQMSMPKYEEAYNIAKFKAQSNGQVAPTFEEMGKILTELEMQQQNAKNQNARQATHPVTTKATHANTTPSSSPSTNTPPQTGPTQANATQVVTPKTPSASNKGEPTFKKIDVNKSRMGNITKSEHVHNTQYVFVCEAITALIDECLNAQIPENIEMLTRAKRLWQAMAYDNGMRYVDAQGKERSIMEMLRTGYEKQSFDGIDNILSSPIVPQEVKTLFEDLQLTHGLHGMADFMQVDFSRLTWYDASKDDVAAEVQSHTNNSEYLQSNNYISGYYSRFAIGDMGHIGRLYLQTEYNFYGGRGTFEQQETAKTHKENLLKFLSQDLDGAKQRNYKLNEAEGNEL